MLVEFIIPSVNKRRAFLIAAESELPGADTEF